MSSEPVWTSTTSWQLVEDLRIGGIDDEVTEIERLADVVSIATDSHGAIYVLDGQSQDVRVFGPDGEPQRTIGRKGNGPGEFIGARHLSIKAGDTLVVLDDGTARYSLLGPDGGLVRSQTRPIVGYGPPMQSVLEDGSYLDWSIEFPGGSMGGPTARFHPVVYEPSFESADTFPPIEYEQSMTGDGRMPLLDFGGILVAAADREGTIWFSDAREYRIVRRSLSGDTTLVIRLDVEPAAIGDAERDRIRGRWANQPDIREAQLAALPASRPVIFGIALDNAGHVFVFPDVAGVTPGTVLDVFRETGVYLGRMSLPHPLRLDPERELVVHLDGEYMYLAVSDSLDVPYVHSLRIVR